MSGSSFRGAEMELPNWLKIVWWIVLIAVIGVFLLLRSPDLISGHALPVDAFVFLVWVSLCLAPFFQELNFFGLKFIQRVDELEAHVDAQVGSLRTEIHNPFDFRPQINPQFNVTPPPPPDAQLPNLEAKIQATIADTLRRYNIQPSSAAPSELDIDSDTTLLFAARYNIERELNELLEVFVDSRPPRFTPPNKIISTLVDTGVIDMQLAAAIRDVYRVCSPAVHGEQFTSAQVKFVRETAPQLIKALRGIKGDYTRPRRAQPTENRGAT
jgi:hypothetical protein